MRHWIKLTIIFILFFCVTACSRKSKEEALQPDIPLKEETIRSEILNTESGDVKAFTKYMLDNKDMARKIIDKAHIYGLISMQYEELGINYDYYKENHKLIDNYDIDRKAILKNIDRKPILHARDLAKESLNKVEELNRLLEREKFSDFEKKYEEFRANNRNLKLIDNNLNSLILYSKLQNYGKGLEDKDEIDISPESGRFILEFLYESMNLSHNLPRFGEDVQKHLEVAKKNHQKARASLVDVEKYKDKLIYKDLHRSLEHFTEVEKYLEELNRYRNDENKTKEILQSYSYNTLLDRSSRVYQADSNISNVLLKRKIDNKRYEEKFGK